MPSTDDYVNLVTNQHRDKPNFIASLRALTQGFVDNLIALLAMPPAFDLDTAVGDQLDAIGLWVGITRRVSVPISGVYFTLDDPALGFDAGVWFGAGDPSEGLVDLDDFTFRLLIRAKIGANRWDGTKPSLLTIINSVFASDQEAVFRSTPGTYFDAAGLMGTALANVARWNYDPFNLATPPVLLLEAAARNYLLKSRKPNASPWVNSGWTITPNATLGIDGVQVAAQFTVATAPAELYQDIVLPANTQFVFSFWYKVIAFTPSNWLTVQLEQISPLGIVTVVPVSGLGFPGPWQRRGFTMTTGAAGPVTMRLKVRGLTVGRSIYLDGFQAEVGSAITSFIETDAVPVDRAADALLPFGTGGTLIFVEDNQDMSMTVGLAGIKPNPLQLALLTDGLLVPKPEGVKVNYAITTNDGGPIFGFDVQNNYVAGFDTGAWASPL